MRNAYGTQVAENYDPYGGGTGTPSGPVPAAPSSGGYLRGSFTYDLMGRLTLQQDYGAAGGGPGMFTGNVYSRSIAYNAKGQVTSDDVSTVKGRYGTLAYDTFRSITTYGYGSGSGYALGSVVTQSATNSKLASGSSSWTSQPGTLTTTTYAWYDGAVQDLVTHDYDTGSGSNPIYTTDLLLNAFGQLTGATVNDGVAKSVAYTNDEAGQIIRRDETRTSAPSEASPHEVFYRFAGRQMGMTGNNGTADMGYVQSVNDRAAARPEPTTSTAGLFRDGTKTGSSAYADFAQSFDPYNSGAQGSAGGTYTARAGDTLQSVAQALWGDANLWYKLAAANGMSGNASLIEGQVLTLPTGVSRSGHSASTFKPYDPTDALGDLSPTTPKPPKKPKCGVFGMILVAAIAIAVVALTQQYEVFAGLGSVLGGAASAAAGSIVSQGFGVATGIQNKFSFKGVAIAAIGGGIGGALGDWSALGKAADGSLKGIANAAIRGAAGSALSQGVGVATGLQSKFDFAGVAAAGVGAGVGAGLGHALGARSLIDDGSSRNIGANMAVGAASLIANAATRSAIKGNSFGDNVIAALPDALGQIVGDAVGGAIARSGRGTGTVGTGMGVGTPGKTVNAPKGDLKAKSAGSITTGQQVERAVLASSGNIKSDVSGFAGEGALGRSREIVVGTGADGEKIYRDPATGEQIVLKPGGTGTMLDSMLGSRDNPTLLNAVVQDTDPYELALRVIGEGTAGGADGIVKLQDLGNYLGDLQPFANGLDDLGLFHDEFKIHTSGLIYGYGDFENPINHDLYTIQKGDTLEGIAARTGIFGIDLIADANGIGDKNQIVAGATLKLPALAYLSRVERGHTYVETMDVKARFGSVENFQQIAGVKYQGFYDEGATLARQRLNTGKLAVRKGFSEEHAIGVAADDFARVRMKRWVASEGLPEGPGHLVQVNRRLYNADRTEYVIPDLRVGNRIWDGSMTRKTYDTPQVRKFFDFGGNVDVYITQPTHLGGTYKIRKEP